MNKRSLEASKESAINEINMGYVAFTRAKKQNIIINAELEGVGCSDVKKRLEAYYNADWGALMVKPHQNPNLSSWILRAILRIQETTLIKLHGVVI